MTAIEKRAPTSKLTDAGFSNYFNIPGKSLSFSEAKQLSEDEPILFSDSEESLGRSTYWLFKGFVYVCSGLFTDEEFRLLILEHYDKERKRFERLSQKFDDNDAKELTYSRPRIPEQVRIEVWRRDGGKCASCGSREKLEYDHIVPLSKGGSNTTRNIELLCEECNRRKSDNIA